MRQSRAPIAGRRLTDLIGQAYAFDDLDEFRQQMPSLLREAVPADYASYNEFDSDPERSWWVLDPPDIDPELVSRFAPLAHQNPILAHMRRTGDGRPRRISDFLDRDAFHRLELYQQFYGPAGVESQVAFTLPSRPPVVVGMALNRGPKDFTGDECALLAAARPHLIQAYRTIELSSARAATIAALEAGLDAIGTPVIVVDANGRIALVTPAARSVLRGRLDVDGHAGRLAPGIVELLARRRERGTPPTEPLILPGSDGEPVVLRVLAGPDGQGTDMLVFEGDTGGLSVIALEGLGLTRREAEALRWVALGRRGPEVARLMRISPRTVEKHLQRVYAKLGVHSSSHAAATAWAAVGVRRP